MYSAYDPVGACHPENPVADVKPGFLGWNVLDQPGHIDAQNERERRVRGQLVDKLPVHRIDAGIADSYQDRILRTGSRQVRHQRRLAEPPDRHCAHFSAPGHTAIHDFQVIAAFALASRCSMRGVHQIQGTG